MKKDSQKNIIQRVKVVAGQLEGVAKMIEQNREFTDIYVQLSSVKASLEKIEDMLVTNEIKSDKKTAELFKIIRKKMISLKELK